jgi:ethanolamine utilization protein EutA (predicted chaperonin)
MSILKSEHMKNIVQEEYDKCLVLNNHINYKQVLKQEESVKKWNNKNKSP